MAKLNEKQKIWTIAGVGLGVCLVAGGGVYWAKGLIEDERKAIEAHKNEIAAAEQKIAKIVPTERDVIILRENIDEYVEIPSYGDKRNDLREAIFKSIQRIRYDKYDHKGSLGRRDMFVDPRTESGPATGVPLSEQKGLVDQAAADLKKLGELMARYLSKDRDAPTIFERYNLEKALRDGIGVMQARIDEVNAKNLVTNPGARRQ